MPIGHRILELGAWSLEKMTYRIFEEKAYNIIRKHLEKYAEYAKKHGRLEEVIAVKEF